ncbi:RHS repeat protein [Herbidospora galbida]|uniref:RHS repeat protein n=1 Tax=Herbidospora galbida TaxID=2575442 RepID=A0A4U3LRX6_9ACTN|nr:RHS repeat protein [Herbidospora galbida]TKK78718.1 RHS repeat protein [Herbidospora galbida]
MSTFRDVHARHAVRRIPLGDAAEVLVDLRDGTPVVRWLDLVVPGTRAHLRLVREYRGDSRHEAGLGPGWRLDPAPVRGPAGEPVVVDDQGRVVTLHLDTGGLITKIVDPLGAQAAVFLYDLAGRPVRHTDAAGATTVFRWDDDDRLTGVEDPAGGALTFTYEGRAVTALDWGVGRLTFAYSPGRTTVTDAAGRVTVHDFDGRGRLTGLGDGRRWAWTDDDLLREETDALGGVVTREHDHEGRLTALRLPTGEKSGAEYGPQTVLRDPAGRELRLDIDDQGRPVRALVPGRDEPLDIRTYHPVHGRPLTFTDGNGHTTSFGYDPAGNLTSVTPPAPLGPVRYAYDGLSRIAGVTGGDGRTVGYRHDHAGRLAEVVDEATGTVLASFSHDGLGRVTRRSGPGWSYAHTWTPTGRGPRISRSVRTADGEPDEVVRYDHSPDGDLLAVTTPGGITAYAYDENGRPATVTTPAGHVARLTHDAAGRLVRVDLGAAVQEIEHDASGRRTALTVRGPDGRPRLAARYAYEGGLLRTAEIDGATVEYAYDGLGRLVAAGGTEYAYDRAHNLVRLGEIAFTLNAAGQVTRFGDTGFTYDGAGDFVEEVNPTGSFAYSPTHQTLTGVFGGIRVVDVSYDGLDQRAPRRITETTVDGRTVTHVLTWSELGLLRVVDDGAPTDLVRSPGGTPLALTAPGGDHHWIVTDHQGSVLALIGADGELTARYRYTPHGAVTAEGPAAALNPLRFLGAYQLLRSAHVLDDHLYNGYWGRFTQPDPRRRAYAPYTFRDNDPVNTGTPARHDFWAVLSGHPVERFFPGPPEPPLPECAGDRIPLIAGEPPARFPLD